MSAYSRSSDVSTLRSKQSGSPVRPNPSTTTEHSGSLNYIAQSGALLEPGRLLDAYEGTAPEPLTRDEHRWLPRGAGPHTPALGRHRRTRGRRHPRGRERNDRRRGLVVAPG
jgi:hypothetical protein